MSVEVHDSPPARPAGWGKAAEVQATFPSRSAAAYCPEFTPSAELRDIHLPAQLVSVRVMVNGWNAPPSTEGGPETWLLQVWPRTAGRS